jgi:anthranilate synthase component I
MKAVPDLRTFVTMARPGHSLSVRVEVAADTETPVSAFLKLSRGERHAFLFESVEGGERVGRWSFLGARPRRVFRWRPGERGDPLKWLERGLHQRPGVAVPGLPRFAGGFVGWLGYDAVPLIEPRVRLSGPDELGLPAACFMELDSLVAFDGLRHRAHILADAFVRDWGDARRAYAGALRKIAWILRALRRPLPPARSTGFDVGPLRPRTERRRFEAAVARAREAICAGDCQQIVVSQRFDARADIPPFELYRALRRVNPSPYLFYMQAGPHALVGSSPETLVNLESGRVTVRPIAGTRPRGRTPAEDERLEAELRADEKENAEHVMLVDLGRNDVGRVCRAGTVTVARFKAVERYSHVMHLVSEVRGEVAPNKGPLDVLRAAFPAGTVTGAPKVRAMELIDRLEPARRGPYAGAVGWFDRLGNMETCIAIRTFVCSPGRVSTQAGAGVVFDSRPAAEYRETLAKAGALRAALAEVTGGAE